MTERLHVYAQNLWHDDAYVIGERDRLEALRDAITEALKTGRGKVTAYINDGEGYAVYVLCVDKQTICRLAVPYTDDMAKEKDHAALWPWLLP